MGKKYDELREQQLETSLEIAMELARIAVALLKIEEVTKTIMDCIGNINDLNMRSVDLETEE